MVLIISGGDAPGNALIQSRAADARTIIAADRGAEYCLKAGVIPDIAVGDMDSITAESLEKLRSHGVKILRYSTHKDQTDTFLALDEAIRCGASRVEMLAALGDRLDHTLANIHLLYHALSRGIHAVILSETRRIFLVDSVCTIEGSEGATLSVLPLTMSVRGIYLSGFQYELTDATMEIGNPYGVSNAITSDRAEIRVGDGILIIVVCTGD